METVKKYKVILDRNNIQKDKDITISLSQNHELHGLDDLIDIRANQKVDQIFKDEYPTIDFEKYCFKPQDSLKSLNMYFYRENISNGTILGYDDTDEPLWVTNSTTTQYNNKFTTTNSVPWNSSYFKFDFYLNYDGEQKGLFTVALPTNGTILNAGVIPRPRVLFNGNIKTEINDIFWLRRPDQLPGTIFTGNTINLYCTVNFYNYLTGKTQRFKTIPAGTSSNSYLPNGNLSQTTFTEKFYFLKYTLNYTTLKYNITRIDDSEFTNGIINLYSN